MITILLAGLLLMGAVQPGGYQVALLVAFLDKADPSVATRIFLYMADSYS